ncbi:WD40/YVTN/BNR-like repeat-containing protein [Marinicella sp. W31]|uniref:WD40/YVTN/BNR-like repeat-containing protein n=1 Tax=Marinicella sp. W31 TaxID=3023713 RepID=UPI0037565203
MRSIFFSLLLMSTVSVHARVDASYKNQSAAWQQHQSMRENTPYHGVEWRNIGPIVQGGRAVEFIKPADQPTVMYVGYASGGVWKSTNNGVTFDPITDHLPSQIVGALAIDPNDSNVLWLGTGENNASRSSYSGMGVYKSNDGGESWAYMGLGDADRIGRIIVDSKDSKRVYVAASGRLYTNGGERGLYRSTDGGNTWETLLPGKNNTGFIDLAMAANGDLYAAAWDRTRRAWNFVESGTGSALYKSTDGGDNWSKLDNGLPYGKYMGRIGIATAASDANVVYVAIDNQTPLPESEWDYGDTAVNPKRLKTMTREEFLQQDPEIVERFLRNQNFPPDLTGEKVIEQIEKEELTVNDLIKQLKDGNANLFNTDIRSLEVYRSDDAGARFYRTHKEDLQGVVFSYGYYFGQIRVDPNDADTVYATGVPLIKSTDGGKTWGSSWTSNVHVDFQTVWIDPNNSQHVVTGNDGGVDESYDGGSSWRKIDYQPVGQFYTIAVDMEKPYNVYGGLQDNGTLKGSSRNKWKNGPTWTRIFGGDGMHVNVDDKDKLTYVGFQFGNSFRLGSSAPKKITPPTYLNEESLRKNWNTPVMMSTHNNDILYFAGHKVYRSLDKGDNWVAISQDLTESGKRGDVPFATITSFSESPLTFGLLWAGTDDGLVWVSENGGFDWKKVSKKLPKSKWVSRIIASPHEEKSAWLALNNYRNDDIEPYLYFTDNLGKSWQRKSAGLPNETINVVKEDPTNKDLVYVGTDKGIYVSNDRGDSWHMLGGDLPTVPVHDLVVHPRENELVLGTHGRSVFIADLKPVQALDQKLKDEQLSIYPIKEITTKGNWRSRPWRWQNTDSEEQTMPVYIWSQQDGAGTLEILDAEERVVFKQNIDVKKGINKWQWNYQIDAEMGLNAEQKRNQSMLAEDESKTLTKVDMPFAESRRLGHEPFITAGKYNLSLKLGDEETKTELNIVKPKKKK